MNDAELLRCDACVADPCVVFAFKVTVVLDFYLDVWGFALNELVLTLEWLLADIEFGSGVVSSTLLPLILPDPMKMFFF